MPHIRLPNLLCGSSGFFWSPESFPMNRFSATKDEQLIEMVVGHRILGNMTNVEFKNVIKDLIWNDWKDGE